MNGYTINKDKVERIMLDQRKTVSDMLELAGISRATWQRIIGSEQATSFPNVTAIAYALHTDPKLLISEAEHEED